MTILPPVNSEALANGLPVFFDYPVYNAFAAERRLINVCRIIEIKPHANVDISGISTTCVEFVLQNENIVVLLDYNTVKNGIGATFGVVDVNGNVT